MFTKQMFTKQMFIKHKFTNTLCLQNKIQNTKFTKQNKSLQTRYVDKTKISDKLCLQNKTKVYKHVMFIKQN